MPEPNMFMIIIAAATEEDQIGANERLDNAIAELPDVDDCGIIDNVHVVKTAFGLEEFFEYLTTAIYTNDKLIVAPLAGRWACQNATPPDECGRLTNIEPQIREPFIYDNTRIYTKDSRAFTQSDFSEVEESAGKKRHPFKTTAE